MVLYYQIVFGLSLLLSFVFICRWKRSYHAYFSLLFVILPLSCYGYLLMATAVDLGQVLAGNMLSYVGGIFGTLVYALCIMNLCRCHVPRPVRIILFSIAIVLFLGVLTIGKAPWFYRSVSFRTDRGFTELVKEYGPLHWPVYAFVIFLYAFCGVQVLLALRRRFEVSKKMAFVFQAILDVSCLAFFAGRLVTSRAELLPASYLVAQLVLVFAPERVTLYGIDEMLAEVSRQRDDLALISLDADLRFLGCNKAAKRFFPELKALRIDDPIGSDLPLFRKLGQWVLLVRKGGGSCREPYESGGRHYEAVGSWMRKGRRKRIKGYTFTLSDNTSEVRYYRLLEKDNRNLQRDVAEKSEEILQINDVFGENVSPQVRDYLLQGNVALGGELRTITVMFCDIRGFTTLSESMPSETVVRLLNRYFTAMEQCISAHDGVINKYIGDAIMALFGAPMPLASHRQDAFLAALDMRRTLVRLNASFQAEGLPCLRFGIALHSGPVLAGNIGAASRMEYTVIGDTVNTASRMEGLCKTYRTDLLLSEEVARAVMGGLPEAAGPAAPQGVRLQFVAEADIRGRTGKVRLYSDGGLKAV